MRRLLSFLGADAAVGYALLGSALQAVLAPLLVMFVVTRLTPAEQGFYYLFGSLLATQLLAELGLTTALLHTASHEWAHVQEERLEGAAFDRLAALLRQACSYYGLIAALVGAALWSAGGLYLARVAAEGQLTAWRGPWLALVVVSAGDLVFKPLPAVLEGCGRVAQVARLGTVRMVCGNIALCLALLLGLGLYALAVRTAVALLVSGMLLLPERRLWGKLLLHRPTPGCLSWRTDVWPLQWRVGVSSLAGVVTFQALTPLLGWASGPVSAGKFGLSLAVGMQIAHVSLVWVKTRAAPMGVAVAKRDFGELDRLFAWALRRGLPTSLGLGLTLLVAVWLADRVGFPVRSRFLDLPALALLLLALAGHHLFISRTVYVRAFKREPFARLWWGTALLSLGASVFLIPRYGEWGACLGLAGAILLVQVALGTPLFLRCRRLWRLE